MYYSLVLKNLSHHVCGGNKQHIIATYNHSIQHLKLTHNPICGHIIEYKVCKLSGRNTGFWVCNNQTLFQNQTQDRTLVFRPEPAHAAWQDFTIAFALHMQYTHLNCAQPQPCHVLPMHAAWSICTHIWDCFMLQTEVFLCTAKLSSAAETITVNQTLPFLYLHPLACTGS